MKKCPNCGATINDVYMKCPDCGYVFTGTTANNNLIKFGEELKRTKDIALKKQIIESVTIPNDKEDLLDFLLILRPHIEDTKEELFRSYYKKYSECIARSHQFFVNDEDFAEHFRFYDFVTAKINKRKKTRIAILISIVFIVLAIILIPDSVSKIRYEKLFNDLKECIQNNDVSGVYKANETIINAIEDGRLRQDNSYNDLSKILKSSLSNVVKENDDMNLADTLLLSIYRLPAIHRFESKNENWEYVMSVADMHFDRNDQEGRFDITDLYSNEYPNDDDFLHYMLDREVRMFLDGGQRSRAKEAAGRTYLYLGKYPKEYKDQIYNKYIELINNRHEYYSFGYVYDSYNNKVSYVRPDIIKLYGITTDYYLVSRETTNQSKKREAALKGELFHQVFINGSDTIHIDMPYCIWNIEE